MMSHIYIFHYDVTWYMSNKIVFKTKCLFTVYITTADETFIIAIHILAFIEDDTNIYSI